MKIIETNTEYKAHIEETLSKGTYTKTDIRNSNIVCGEVGQNRWFDHDCSYITEGEVPFFTISPYGEIPMDMVPEVTDVFQQMGFRIYKSDTKVYNDSATTYVYFMDCELPFGLYSTGKQQVWYPDDERDFINSVIEKSGHPLFAIDGIIASANWLLDTYNDSMLNIALDNPTIDKMNTIVKDIRRLADRVEEI